jgi:hypothetical protein
MSDITIICPGCNQELDVPQDLLGQVVECPACQQSIQLPAPAPANTSQKKIIVKAQRPATPTRPATQRPAAQPERKGMPPAQVIAVVIIFIVLIAAGVVINGGFGWLLPSCGDQPSAPSPARLPAALPHREPPSTGPVLLLLNWSWSQEHGYAIVEGEVKNISSHNLDNIEAVASFYTAADRFITTADALIDFNPILPGQTSPFKAMANWNPEMSKARIDFKELMGGTVQWKKQD